MSQVKDVLTRARFDLKDIDKINFPVTTAVGESAELLEYLNRAIQRISLRLIELGSDLARKTTTLDLVAEIREVAAPVDFERFVYRVDPTTGERRPLVYETSDTADDCYKQLTLDEALEHETNVYSEPDSVCVVGETFWFLPITDIGRSVILYYFYQQAALVTGDDTMPWRGRFDLAITQFVVALALNRDEYNVEFEAQAAARYLDAAFGNVFSRELKRESRRSSGAARALRDMP